MRLCVHFFIGLSILLLQGEHTLIRRHPSLSLTSTTHHQEEEAHATNQRPPQQPACASSFLLTFLVRRSLIYPHTIRHLDLTLTETPLMASTSMGEGMKSTTASRRGCTPLFLKAVPVSTGTNTLSRVPARRHFFSVSIDGSSPCSRKKDGGSDDAAGRRKPTTIYYTTR